MTPRRGQQTLRLARDDKLFIGRNDEDLYGRAGRTDHALAADGGRIGRRVDDVGDRVNLLCR